MTARTAGAGKLAETRAEEDLLKTRTVLLDGNDIEAKRAEILEYFHKTFTIYEELFETLADDEAYYLRAEPLRHPLIFYYGHTAVFWMNKLNYAGIIEERIDPKMESMLAIGVDEMSWDDLDERNYDWPTPAAVKVYRDKTRDIVDAAIREMEFTLPIRWDSPMWVIMMGIEHERIHLETSSVIIRRLPIEHVRPHPLFAICDTSAETPQDAPQNALLPVSGGQAVLGKDRKDPVYGWDNEYGRFETHVDDYRASKYLVSNAEFYEFVKDGGYTARKYWTEEGWNWALYTEARHPLFWIPDGDSYRYRAMVEEIDMPWDWPVDLNYLEAKAFCNWKSEQAGTHIRMPTEAEWHMLRSLVPEDQPTWDEAPGNINLEHFASACPVDMFEFDGGFCDIIGNVWQWSETPIDAFEGYEVHPVYDDFSAPTFDSKHNMIRGGCFISTGNYAIRDSRYGFRRHFFQHAGLRYVEGDPVQIEESNVYETDTMVSQYIEFHYGEPYLDVPNFPKACAGLCLEHMKGRDTKRALDLGCAAGRTSFELARVFDHVDAIDFSARLIRTPVALQEQGHQRYVIQDEGDLVTHKVVRLADYDFAECAGKVNFMQGDACNLVDKFTDYDLVFAGNLIDRLYEPAKFLEMIQERVRPGGILVLTSPYTWLEEFTDRDKWIGGIKDATGETRTTRDGLKDILGAHFDFVEARDMPFVLRETRRKFHYVVADATVWYRKD